MNKTLFLLVLLIFTINSYSQSLFVLKVDNSNLSSYISSLQKLNSSDGTILDNLNSSYPQYNLTFNSLTNEIFGRYGNFIVKKNIITNAESFFSIPNSFLGPMPFTEYHDSDLIIANNRLFFLTRVHRDYFTQLDIYYLLEINQLNGQPINRIYIDFPNQQTAPGDQRFAFSSTTNEIFALDITRNIIRKANIDTQSNSFQYVCSLPNESFSDIIIAENRLFISQINNQNEGAKLLELNKSNGSIINSYSFTDSNCTGLYSLTFLSNTHEVCGIAQNKIIKYNIISGTESSFDIIGLDTSISFGPIVSTTIEQMSSNEYHEKSSLKIYPNPLSDVVIIQNKENTSDKFKYRIVDLTSRIIVSGNSNFNNKINLESLKSGSYIIQIETENAEKYSEKIIKN